MSAPINVDPRPASGATANAGRTALSTLVLGLWSTYTLAPKLLASLGVPADMIAAQTEIAAPVIAAAGVGVLAAIGTALRNRAHRYGGLVAEIAGAILP